MKKIFGIMIMVSLLLVTFTAQATAGAWTRKKGGTYSRLSVNYYYSDKYYVDNSDYISYPYDGDFEDYNLNYYGEYGITDRLSLIGSVYYKMLFKEDDTIDMESKGIGDIDLALKYNLVDHAVLGVLSVQGLVKIPEAYDEDDDLPLGTGQWDGELKLLYGRSLYPLLPGYVNLEAGYRWRNEDPDDEFRFLAEAGMNFGQKWYGRVKLDGTICIESESGDIDAYGNPTATENYDLIKLDVIAGYKFSDRWAVEIAYTPSIYGEWTAKGATYTMALVLETP